MDHTIILRQTKKIRISDLVGDALCCLFSSAALSLVLLTTLGHSVGFWSCMLLSAFSLLLVLAFTRRWWLLPGFLAAAGILTFFISWIFGLGDGLLDYWKGFFVWASSAFPIRLPYSENGSILLVRLAAVLPVTAAMYLYFRKLFFFPLLPLGFGALLIWNYFTGAPHLHTVLVMALAVTIAALAKHTGRKVGKRQGEGLPEGILQIPALILAFIVLLFAFAFSPKADGDWKSDSINQLVNDLGDYWNFRIYDASGSGSFDLSMSGFLPYKDRLGGNIEPDNEPVLRITTDTPILLMGNVSDTYTGKSWIDTGQLGRFRLHSALWQNRRREVFTLDKPLGGSEARRLYTLMSGTSVLKISPALRSLTLFGSGRILDIQTLQGGAVDAYFNLQSELFYEEGWKAYNTYIITTDFYNRDAPDFDKNMLALEQIAYEKKDAYYEDILERYLQLPESLPSGIAQLALDITFDKSSPYEKAVAIEDWISEHSTYTQTPGDVPEDRDFVDYFLETREGYCTYYASAMTVLARASGLPARYCTGYAMLRATEGSYSSYVSTNATAHAWTEIYFQGIGWVTFDPSGWNFSELLEPDKPSGDQGPITPPVSPNPGGMIGELPEEPVAEPPITAPAGGSKQVWLSLLWILAGLIGILLLFFAFRLLLTLVGANQYYYRLHRKYRNTADMLNAAYGKLLRQLGFIGLKLQQGETISAFAQRVDAHMGNCGMSEVVQPVLRHRYALKKVRDADVRALCNRYIDTEKKIRVEMGLPRYLWRRILLGR